MAHTYIHPLSFHTHLLSACCHTVRHGASGRSWGAHQLFWTSDNHVSICDLLLLGDCHAFRLSPALGLTLPRTMGALGHMTTPSKGVYSLQSSSVQPSFPFERLSKAGSTRLGHIRALVRRSCSLTSPRTRTPIHKPSGHLPGRVRHGDLLSNERLPLNRLSGRSRLLAPSQPSQREEQSRPRLRAY